MSAGCKHRERPQTLLGVEVQREDIIAVLDPLLLLGVGYCIKKHVYQFDIFIMYVDGL